MRPLSDEDIRSYIHRDHPVDCAGAYKLEKAGIQLFERIESEDHTAIVGVHILALSQILIESGHGFAF